MSVFRKIFIHLFKKKFKPSLLKKLAWWYSFYYINKKKGIQKNEFQAMKDIIGRDEDYSAVIIDGGSNIGLYAMFLKLYFPEARIICIEPNEHLPLKENVGDFATILNCALGEENKKVGFYFNDYSAASSVLYRPTESKQRKINIEMRTLDSLFPNAKVDILKLDLEGYDYQALLGAKELLKRTKIVFIETEFRYGFWAGQDKTIFDVQKLLEPYGFQLHSLYDMGFNEKGEIQTSNAMFVKY